MNRQQKKRTTTKFKDQRTKSKKRRDQTQWHDNKQKQNANEQQAIFSNTNHEAKTNRNKKKTNRPTDEQPTTNQHPHTSSRNQQAPTTSPPKHTRKRSLRFPRIFLGDASKADAETKCKIVRREIDAEGIRGPAGRAQWISTPSPWPLGHSVLALPSAGASCHDYALYSAGCSREPQSLAPQIWEAGARPIRL